MIGGCRGPGLVWPAPRCSSPFFKKEVVSVIGPHFDFGTVVQNVLSAIIGFVGGWLRWKYPSKNGG